MKTDKVSFGQTYIKPSLVKYMKQKSMYKIPYIIGLGEFYPADIYIGANIKGELTVDIMHSTAAKHLFFSDAVSKTFENVTALNYMHNMERVQRIRNGIRVPIIKSVIGNIENLSVKDLQLAVNDKIKLYYETLGKKFFN